MAIFRDSLGNVIATNGENQPAAFQLVYVDPGSVSPSQNAGVTPVADVKYNDATTGNLVADRS